MPIPYASINPQTQFYCCLKMALNDYAQLKPGDSNETGGQMVFEKNTSDAEAIHIKDKEGKIYKYTSNNKRKPFNLEKILLGSDNELAQPLLHDSLRQVFYHCRGKQALCRVLRDGELFADSLRHEFNIEVVDKQLLVNEIITIKSVSLKDDGFSKPVYERKAGLPEQWSVKKNNENLCIDNNQEGLISVRVHYRIELQQVLAPTQASSIGQSLKMVDYQFLVLDSALIESFWRFKVPQIEAVWPTLRLRVLYGKVALLELDNTVSTSIQGGLGSEAEWLPTLKKAGIDKIYLFDKTATSKTLACRVPIIVWLEAYRVATSLFDVEYIYPVTPYLNHERWPTGVSLLFDRTYEKKLPPSKAYTGTLHGLQEFLDASNNKNNFYCLLKPKERAEFSSDYKGIDPKLQQMMKERKDKVVSDKKVVQELSSEDCLDSVKKAVLLSDSVDFSQLIYYRVLYYKLRDIDTILLDPEVTQRPELDHQQGFSLSQPVINQLWSLRKKCSDIGHRDSMVLMLQSFLKEASLSVSDPSTTTVLVCGEEIKRAVDQAREMTRLTLSGCHAHTVPMPLDASVRDINREILEWQYLNEVKQRQQPGLSVKAIFTLHVEELKAHLGKTITRIGQRHKKAQLLQRFIDERCQSEQLNTFLQDRPFLSLDLTSEIGELWQAFTQKVFIDVSSEEACAGLSNQQVSLANILQLRRPIFSKRLSQFTGKTRSYRALCRWQAGLTVKLVNDYASMKNKPYYYTNDAILELNLGRLMVDHAACIEQLANHRAETHLRLGSREDKSIFKGSILAEKLIALLKKAQGNLSVQSEKDALQGYLDGLSQWQRPLTIDEVLQKLPGIRQAIRRDRALTRRRPWWSWFCFGLGPRGPIDRLIVNLDDLSQEARNEKTVLKKEALNSASIALTGDLSLSSASQSSTMAGLDSNHGKQTGDLSAPSEKMVLEKEALNPANGKELLQTKDFTVEPTVLTEELPPLLADSAPTTLDLYRSHIKMGR